MKKIPTRPTTSAMNWAQPTNDLPGVLDVIGLNYQGAGIRKTPGTYPAFHEQFPDKMIIGSETASALSSRGEYVFPVAASNSASVGANSGEDQARHQVSAYELYSAAFGSSADRVFASQEKHPYVGGEFVWTGWDYLGEPTPFDSSRSSYSGIIDLAGLQERPVLFLSGALAAGFSDGAHSTALDMAGTCRPNYTGSRFYVRRRGGAFFKRQIPGAEKERGL